MTNLTERAQELRKHIDTLAINDDVSRQFALRDLADLVCELAEAVARPPSTGEIK